MRPFTSAPPASTAGFRWKFRRCWPTTPKAPSPRPNAAREGQATEPVHQDSRHQKALPAIEEAIFSGVPVNVTLLFLAEHYLDAADAYMRGLERRVAAGLSPDVRSVASLFVSRWDKATLDKVPADLRNTLGIAVGQQSYKAYRDCWTRIAGSGWRMQGARPQRLLFASTGTKDPQASDVLYMGALAAPNTVNTMPEKTLLAFADHGQVSRSFAAGRRRWRAGAGGVRQGRHRCCGAGRQSAR